MVNPMMSIITCYFVPLFSCDECWIGLQCVGSSPSNYWDDGTTFDPSSLTLSEDCRTGYCLYLEQSRGQSHVKRKQCDHDRKVLCMLAGKWYCAATVKATCILKNFSDFWFYIYYGSCCYHVASSCLRNFTS